MLWPRQWQLLPWRFAWLDLPLQMELLLLPSGGGVEWNIPVQIGKPSCPADRLKSGFRYVLEK